MLAKAAAGATKNAAKDIPITGTLGSLSHIDRYIASPGGRNAMIALQRDILHVNSSNARLRKQALAAAVWVIESIPGVIRSEEYGWFDPPAWLEACCGGLLVGAVGRGRQEKPLFLLDKFALEDRPVGCCVQAPADEDTADKKLGALLATEMRQYKSSL